jgi:iron complex transport system substrate-binding protein
MKKAVLFLTILALCAMLGAFLGLSGCQSNCGQDPSFINFGKFTVKKLPDNCKEIRDGIGRTLVLVPRGQKPPVGYARHQLINVPVQRVVVYSDYHISILKALGVMKDVLVGVTKEKEHWSIQEIRKGMEDGTITYLGESNAIDFEKLKAVQPDLVLTWDQRIISMIGDLDIPCVITSTGVAMDLDARMQFAQFLALFFNKEHEANEFVSRVSRTIDRVGKMNASVEDRPKVIWGDIYEKRVLVEPGNSWAAEMVRLAGGEYLFDDVFGAA